MRSTQSERGWSVQFLAATVASTSVVDPDLNEWAVANAVLNAVPAPLVGDRSEHPPSLFGIGDDPGGRRQVGDHLALQVEYEMGIGLQIGQPVPLLRPGDAADINPTVDVVEDDLLAAGLTRLAPGGGDVDDVALRESRPDIVVHAPS